MDEERLRLAERRYDAAVRRVYRTGWGWTPAVRRMISASVQLHNLKRQAGGHGPVRRHPKEATT